MFSAGATRAREQRLAGDARPLPHPHAALPARRTPAPWCGISAISPTPKTLPSRARRQTCRSITCASTSLRSGTKAAPATKSWWKFSPPGWRRYESILEADSDRLLDRRARLLTAKGITSPARSPSASPSPTPASRPSAARAWWRRPGPSPPIRALMLADGTKAAESLDIPMRGLPAARRAGGYAGRASPRRLHAVQLLSARGARLSAVLVQVRRLPRPRRARPARAAGRVRARSCPPREAPRRGQHRRLSLDGAAVAPAGTEGWPAERLAGMVRDGDMIGVTLVHA